MATAYTLAANATLRDIGTAGIWGVATARTGGDTIDTNGFIFTQDQDSRYGLSGNTSASWGNLTINAAKGGEIVFDARYVRLIPFNTGSGTITAGATITCGSATGKVIGIYSAVNTAPVLTGVATGFIKVTAWNGVAFPTSGAYTQAGYTFTITGADTAGWIEVVADEGASAAFTMNRLGTVRAKGAWYEFAGATTTGTRTTQYQVPTNGSLTHIPGVMVQSAAATITAASWTGGIATVTAAAHGFNIGQEVTITGSTPSGYNVSDVAITATTTNTFSYAVASDPGTWTSGGSAYVYDFWPAAGSRPALVANIQTDIVRGKWCWVTTAGLLSFGYDGTNSTGGYCPPSGRKLRMANIITTHCTTAARTANVAPNVVAATRFEFVTGGGGVIDFDKVNMGWYMNMAQPYSVSLTNTFTFETLILTECAQPIAWNNVGVGQSATALTATTTALVIFGLDFAGGTLKNCTWTRLAQAGATTQVASWTDCTGFTVTNERTYSLTKSANASSGSAIMTRVINTTFTNTSYIGSGMVTVVGCDTVTWTNTTYVDNILGTTVVATIPFYLWSLTTAASYSLKFDGMDFGGQTMVQPASGIVNIGVAGCNDIKVRNIGTAASPLDMGGAQVDGTFTQATTVVTCTKTAHGLKTGDIIYVLSLTPGASTFTVGSKTLASAPTADTFTITVTTGTEATPRAFTYYPTVAAVLVNFLAGGAANSVKIQRCYAPHLRTGLIATQDNSANNILMESVQGDQTLALLNPILNTALKMVWATPALTKQTSCYGTHFFDYFTTGIPTSMSAQSWARTTTTATVTSTGHNLRTGDQIVVTTTSDAAAIIKGVKSITVLTSNTFTFTCLNAGAASGTITFQCINGRIAIEMNEATAATSAQVTLSNGAAFTSLGSLYMPTINHQAEWTFPYSVRGHKLFPIAEAVMLTGTIANYHVTYSVDGGTTWKNLYYPRPGGGGASGASTITMTSTTDVASGDYVWGTNVGYNCKVVSVDNATTCTVDTANLGTVSGVLRFNQLPSQTIADPAVGLSLKIRVKTTTANTTAFDALSVYTYSDATSRAATYDMDTNTLTFTGLPTGCDAVTLTAGTSTILDSKDSMAGTTYSYTYSGAQTVDVGFIKPGYVPFYIRNLSLTTTDSSIPVSLTLDRNYQ
jgi:hypothetical protein